MTVLMKDTHILMQLRGNNRIQLKVYAKDTSLVWIYLMMINNCFIYNYVKVQCYSSLKRSFTSPSFKNVLDIIYVLILTLMFLVKVTASLQEIEGEFKSRNPHPQMFVRLMFYLHLIFWLLPAQLFDCCELSIIMFKGGGLINFNNLQAGIITGEKRLFFKEHNVFNLCLLALLPQIITVKCIFIKEKEEAETSPKFVAWLIILWFYCLFKHLFLKYK